MQPRCPECGVARGDGHEPDCSRHDVEYTPPSPPTPRPRDPVHPRGPDPFIAADPFWGPLASKRKRIDEIRAEADGWFRMWMPFVVVLAAAAGLLIGLVLPHGGARLVPPQKVYGDCHLEIYDSDVANTGLWTKVTTPGYDCPPMQVWPTVLVNR